MSGTVYVLDEFQVERIQRKIEEAQTLDELKEALVYFLKELPIEYVDS